MLSGLHQQQSLGSMRTQQSELCRSCHMTFQVVSGQLHCTRPRGGVQVQIHLVLTTKALTISFVFKSRQAKPLSGSMQDRTEQNPRHLYPLSQP